MNFQDLSSTEYLKTNTGTSTPINSLSPNVQIDELKTPRGKIFVAREDLLPGGTKQRAIAPYLTQLAAQGYKRFTYASPFCGFAQVALAVSAQQLGLSVLLFAEKDQTQSDRAPHEFTRLAASYGSKVELCDTLAQAEEMTSGLAETDSKTFKIPLGFADKNYESLMQEQITEQLAIVEKTIGFVPQRIWLPIGSGTLSGVFAKAIGPETLLMCVDVGVLHYEDARIQKVQHLDPVTYFKVTAKFHEPCLSTPPVPSNIHYDAKLWPVILAHGQPNDLWWNVAR